MKKVLIALDYDPSAQKVAETGFAMAKAMKAEVIIMHVMSDPVHYSSTGYDPIMGYAGFINIAQMQKSSNDELIKASQEFLDKTKLHLGDNTIQTLVEDGDCAEAILKVAKNHHAEVIVMGSHSHRWLENILMGSATESVLHHTTKPLFIVPTKKPK